MRNLKLHSNSALQWRPIDSRFAQLESRLTHHRRWLAKETESQVQDFAEIEQHRKRYIRSLHRQAEPIGSNGELERDRIAKRLRRVEVVRGWVLKASQTTEIIESTSIEHLGSCNWFMDLSNYRTWKGRKYDCTSANNAKTLQDDWHDRILFVQGTYFVHLECYLH